MSEDEKKDAASERTQDQIVKLIDRLFAITRPGAVFSEPIEAEGTTIITASEVSVGVGVGFGEGSGSGLVNEEQESEESVGGSASGGGGGGGASGRPVAVISVNKYGVEVEPVIDTTKLGLGFFAAFTSLVIMLGSMRRAG